MSDDKNPAAISELANSLQVAVPTAVRIRQRLDEQTRDADVLDAALARAIQALRQLQPARTEDEG